MNPNDYPADPEPDSGSDPECNPKYKYESIHNHTSPQPGHAANHKPCGYQPGNNQTRGNQACDNQTSNRQVREPAISPDINTNTNQDTNNKQSGLNAAQQQFVLRFCRQLASVIQACEHSESAEIEVGRRQIGSRSIKVKLRSERE